MNAGTKTCLCPVADTQARAYDREIRRYKPDGAVAAVIDVVNHRGGGDLVAQVVVRVHRQPEVTVHKGCEGQSLSPGSHFQLLRSTEGGTEGGRENVIRIMK